MKQVSNPYAQPFHEWKPEVLAAYQTFPLVNGMTAPMDEKNEAAWREWCRQHPRPLWPAWVLAWIAEKQRRKANAERVDLETGEIHTSDSTKAIDDTPTSA